MTLSPMQESILRLLAEGPRGDREVDKLKHNATEPLRIALKCAHESGLVKRSGGRWHITAKGKKALPPRSVSLPQTVYQPPKVYRRPGSDHSWIPSHYGDAR